MAKPNPVSTSRRAVTPTGVSGGDQRLGTGSEDEISAGEDADILGVSRLHLMGLLDAGHLPYRKSSEKPGAHRYVTIDDVLDYRRRRANAQAMMDQYGAISEALGV